MREIGQPGRWWEFGQFVARILALTPGISISPTAFGETVAGLPPGTPDEGFDLIGERNGRPLLVAVKSRTPQTRARLAITTDRLQAAAKHYQQAHKGASPKLLAVFPVARTEGSQ